MQFSDNTSKPAAIQDKKLFSIWFVLPALRNESNLANHIVNRTILTTMVARCCSTNGRVEEMIGPVVGGVENWLA